MDNARVSGDAAKIFDTQTRATISRYVDDMEGEQLLDLLGHLILKRREGYKTLGPTVIE